LSRTNEHFRVSLDASSLFDALDAARAAQGLQWKQVAEQTGVSASTLTRIAQGKRPDVDGFAALTAWLGNDPRTFFTGDSDRGAEVESGDAVSRFVSALFRANPNLTNDERDALKSLATSAFRLATRGADHQ
jgi:transcriptional regulator with XRE-family HTH domain